MHCYREPYSLRHRAVKAAQCQKDELALARRLLPWMSHCETLPAPKQIQTWRMGLDLITHVQAANRLPSNKLTKIANVWQSTWNKWYTDKESIAQSSDITLAGRESHRIPSLEAHVLMHVQVCKKRDVLYKITKPIVFVQKHICLLSLDF